MYLIANATSSFVELADLGISLKPKQAIDLHAMGCKGKAEVSDNLKKAIKNGWIKVLKMDRPASPSKEIIKERVIERSSEVNKEEMLGSIRKIIQEEIKSIKIDNSNNIPNNLLETLSELIKKGSIQQNSIDKSFDESDGIDVKKMQKIHTKVAEKVMKGASSSVNYNEETVKDSSMKSNIAELEDLI
jgi:hypothetical protein